LSEAPRPIGEVISFEFVLLFVISLLAVYAYFAVDRLLYRRGFLSRRQAS